MKVFDMTTIRPNMGDTRTYADFAKFLGAKPHRLGIVSKMYPELTASYLTESLMNIYTNQKSPSKFQQIDALLFEWELDIEYIKRVEFAAVPEGDGSNGSDIVFAFKERYYEKYDTFRIEKSRQQVIVKYAPQKIAADHWVVVGQIIDNDGQSLLDASACQPNMQTRFLTNYHPELSEEGYTKYQSNIERHREHISIHRNDVSFSSQFAALEDVFISTGKNEGKGTSAETIYKMKRKEQELLTSFLEARNNALLFGKSSIDVNGKSTVMDPATNRPIMIGNGIIPQIERFANKYGYAKLSIEIFDTIMEFMRQKSKKSTGNQYVFIVNERLWSQIQRVLRAYLKDWKTDGTFFYSKKAGKNVAVGTTFDTYEMGGNQISFQVDKAFTLEYPDRAYGIVIDLTADATSGTPAMQMFTLKGGEFIRGVLKGVGGLDGVTSGDISSPVAGSKIVHMGYAGVGVYNPYRSFIIEENQ